LRKRVGRLQNTIVGTVGKSTMMACGRKLGIVKKNTLVFENESEMAVWADYCIYDSFQNGRNPVERYFAEHPPDPGSDEAVIADAMIRARYRLLQIVGVERGLGVHVLDLAAKVFQTGDGPDKEAFLLVDLGFSRTAPVGMHLASRTISFGDFSMTTGAGLPIGDETVDAMERNLNGSLGDDYCRLANGGHAREARAKLSLAIIRACLAGGTSSGIIYAEAGESLPRARRRLQSSPFERPRAEPDRLKRSGPGSIPRNAPCPCGSGRKYKKCCAKLGIESST
jgi:hypothetical protein